MAEYRIVPAGPGEFAVEGETIRGKIRGFVSVRGFPTEEAARSWMEERLSADGEATSPPADVPDAGAE